MSAPTMEELLPLLGARDLAPLVGRLDDLDDAARKKLVKPVRALSRSGQWGDPPRDLIRGLSVLGPAVLPDARSTAAWIRRFAGWPSVPDDRPTDRYGNRIEILSPTSALIVEVLVRRDVVWLPALVRELADRLRFDDYDPDDYLLIEGLRTRVGLPPPAVPSFVAMWVRTAWRSRSGDVDVDVVELIHAEPAYASLLPLAFEVDEIAGVMRHRDHLRRLADSGAVTRDALLDAALARLQRGGRPQATNEFVRDLESLGPTVDEVADRIRDHLALLPPGSATSVANLAQHQLIRLHGEGRLSSAELLEMSRSVLMRTEKKVLRAQLAYLRTHADAVPADADLVARAASVAFGHAAPDIQRGAVDLLARLAPRLSSEVAIEIAAAGEALPVDLRQRLTTALGASVPEPAELPRMDPVPPPDPPGAVVPIATVEELIEELAAILHSEPLDARGATLDRVVEALPRLGLSDREALRRVAAPVTSAGTYRYYLENAGEFDFTLRRALVVLMASCVGDSWIAPAPDFYAGRRGAPARAYAVRIFALAKSVQDDPTVRVVALPSRGDGAIAPSDLLARLTDAAARSWTPDPVDLEQALLRLDLSGATAEPFAALGSAAGRQVATWVRAAGHRPPIIRVERAQEYLDTLNLDPYERATAVPRSSPMAVVQPAADDPSPAGPLWSELSRWSVPRGGLMVGWAPDDAFETWPLVLPHHGDVVAAHLLPELSRARSTRSQGASALVALTETSDPIGPALMLGLAYLAGGRTQESWSAAADGLLVLATRRRLDGDAVGEMLVALVEHGDVVAKRLVVGLGDAARGGAAKEIWTALAHLLSGLLRRAPKAAGIVDLLVLAAEVAVLADAVGPIDGLDDLASRAGRSRQVVEARRLREILEQPRTT